VEVSQWTSGQERASSEEAVLSYSNVGIAKGVAVSAKVEHLLLLHSNIAFVQTP